LPDAASSPNGSNAQGAGFGKLGALHSSRTSTKAGASRTGRSIDRKHRTPAAAALCERYAVLGLLSKTGSNVDADRGATLNAD